jgi:hypothetical protein
MQCVGAGGRKCQPCQDSASRNSGEPHEVDHVTKTKIAECLVVDHLVSGRRDTNYFLFLSQIKLLRNASNTIHHFTNHHHGGLSQRNQPLEDGTREKHGTWSNRRSGCGSLKNPRTGPKKESIQYLPLGFTIDLSGHPTINCQS